MPTKKAKQIAELLDVNKDYSVDEALELFNTIKSNNFDESIDIVSSSSNFHIEIIVFLRAENGYTAPGITR